MEKFKPTALIQNSESISKLKEHFKTKFTNITDEELEKVIEEENKGKVFINDLYHV